MTYFLDLRVDTSGGGVAHEVTPRLDSTVCPLANLVAKVRGKEVLLGTHGFNVNRKDGIESLSLWERKLQLPASTMFIGILWPGDAKLPIFVDYPVEGDEAIGSGNLLAQFLDDHFAEVTSLSFVSHSLGARIVLQTISAMQRKRVRSLVLMAGAVENNCLSVEYKAAADKVEWISILASRGDWVLAGAFPLGNLVRDLIDRDHPYWSEALGREGPDGTPRDNVRPNWQIPDNWNYGHLDFLKQNDGGPLPPPVDIPPVPDLPEPPPSPPANTSAWSAGFTSTRLM
jgi:hypothetical protein